MKNWKQNTLIGMVAIEAHAPLVAVNEPGAKLVMYDKVTLQNNKNSGNPLGGSSEKETVQEETTGNAQIPNFTVRYLIECSI